ncbi:MAG: hypothetical protein ACREQ9_26070, partial [Candidatus Binatia bacterium]
DTSITCEKTAVDVQVIPTVADVARVILSRATASMSNVPEDCICLPGDICFPCRNLTRSTIDGDFDPDGECPAVAEVGDRLNLALDVVNSSASGCAPLTLSVIARIDPDLDVDTTSATVDGVAMAATVDACPDDIAFNGCPGETPIDTDRDCMTVDIGAVAPGQSKLLEFSGDVNADEASICMTARIIRQGTAGPVADKELTFFVPTGDCGTPIPATDTLKTTGSGGCAIGATRSSPSLDFWPILVLAGLVAMRRSLRRR